MSIKTLLAAALAALLSHPAAAWEVDAPLKFVKGTAKMRAQFQAIPALRELMAEDFAAAAHDLDDDGHNELIVISRSSAFCGSGGCMAVVVQVRNGRARVLLQQNLDENLAVTREKVGAFRALAQLDARGAIQVADKKGTPMHGQPMIYPLAGARLPAATAVATAAPPPSASPAATEAGAGPGIDVLGIKLGASKVPDVERLLRQMQPGASLQPTETELIWAPPNAPKLPIQGSRHVSKLWLYSHGSRPCPTGQQCNNVAVHFQAPPSGQVVAVKRDGSFPPTPLDTFMKALTDKYGTPSSREVSPSMTLVHWIWGRDGRLLTAAPKQPCRAPDTPSEQAAESFLARNCAQVVSAQLMPQNGLVNLVLVQAYDAAADARGRRETEAYMQRYADDVARRQREAAAGTAAPRN
jgi:hypothetical protein